jgi:hypothetical protein
MRSCRWLFVLAIAGLGGLQGCSETPTIPKTVEVSGTVTLDGKPLSEGTVNFSSSSTGDAAIAQLKEGGRFLFGNGVLPGTYRVTITGPVNNTPPAPGVTPPVLKFQIPSKYSDPATTDLKATVTTEVSDFKFDLVK